jgi:hypothetical protein
MADAREPQPTQRCRLHGGRFDGQLRLVATGPTLTLTVQHQLKGELWAEIYTQEEVAGADVPVAWSVIWCCASAVQFAARATIPGTRRAESPTSEIGTRLSRRPNDAIRHPWGAQPPTRSTTRGAGMVATLRSFGGKYSRKVQQKSTAAGATLSVRYRPPSARWPRQRPSATSLPPVRNEGVRDPSSSKPRDSKSTTYGLVSR